MLDFSFESMTTKTCTAEIPCFSDCLFMLHEKLHGTIHVLDVCYTIPNDICVAPRNCYNKKHRPLRASWYTDLHPLRAISVVSCCPLHSH